MRIFDLPLEEKLEEGKPHLVVYLQDKMPADPQEYRLPAVLVCPGGGYTHLSPREAEPIALAFAAKGFQTFVLYYSLLPRRIPKPLLDGAKAMNLIRDHADEWDVDPHKIAICGFSAGGHLAAMLSTLWREPVIEQAGLSCEKSRPDAAILGYAVVTAGEDEARPGRLAEKLGDVADPLVHKAAFLTKEVSEFNPPTFLWHTAADQTVPVANSLLMAKALAERKVPFELHIYLEGAHGLALAERRTSGGDPAGERSEVAGWMELACGWLKRTFQLD